MSMPHYKLVSGFSSSEIRHAQEAEEESKQRKRREFLNSTFGFSASQTRPHAVELPRQIKREEQHDTKQQQTQINESTCRSPVPSCPPRAFVPRLAPQQSKACLQSPPLLKLEAPLELELPKPYALHDQHTQPELPQDEPIPRTNSSSPVQRIKQESDEGAKQQINRPVETDSQDDCEMIRSRPLHLLADDDASCVLLGSWNVTIDSKAFDEADEESTREEQRIKQEPQDVKSSLLCVVPEPEPMQLEPMPEPAFQPGLDLKAEPRQVQHHKPEPRLKPEAEAEAEPQPQPKLKPEPLAAPLSRASGEPRSKRPSPHRLDGLTSSQQQKAVDEMRRQRDEERTRQAAMRLRLAEIEAEMSRMEQHALFHSTKQWRQITANVEAQIKREDVQTMKQQVVTATQCG